MDESINGLKFLTSPWHLMSYGYWYRLVVSQFGEIFTMSLLFFGESIVSYFICTESYFVLFKSPCNFVFICSGEIKFQPIISSQH